MTEIEKKIRQANLAANSWDFETVRQGYNALLNWTKNFTADAGNQKAITATKFRLAFQGALITLLNGGFLQADYDRVTGLLDRFPADAFAVTDEEFHQAVFNFEKAAAFYTRMREMLPEYYEWVLKGRAVTESGADDLTKIRELGNVIDEFSQAYTGGILTQKVHEALTAMKQRAEMAYEGTQTEQFGSYYASVMFHADEFKSCKYYNNLLDGPGGSYKVAVVAAPNREEIDLIVSRFASNHERKIVGVDFEALCALPNSAIEYVLRRLERESRGQVLYVVGFGNADWKQEETCAMLSRLTGCFEGAENSVLADGKPTLPVYTALETICPNFARRMGYLYASMPDFEDFEQLLREQVKDWREEDRQMLQRYGSYVGFIGLNEVMNNADDWKRHIEVLGVRWRNLVLSFTGGMKNPELLIDSGWNLYSGGTGGTFDEDDERKFDYDDVPPLLQSNVRKILEGPFTFMQKAGLLVRYTITHGEDIGRWETDYSTEEHVNRIMDATMALAKWLQLPAPQVIIDPEDMEEWYAGLCCNGGQVVHYSYSCAHKYNVEFTMEVIMHELYHAVQAKVRREPWQNWFETDLGITVERKKYWKLNDESYIDLRKNKKAYQVQVVEVDANVFAIGCLRMASEVWSQLSLD